MKPETRLNQHTSCIRITMFKQPQLSAAEFFPNSTKHDYWVLCLNAYVPLWKEFFDQPIKADCVLWTQLFDRCQFDLLPSQDSWIQYTANEILIVLVSAKSRFKKDCEKNHPVGSLRSAFTYLPSNDPRALTKDEIWHFYCKDYYVQMHLED